MTGPHCLDSCSGGSAVSEVKFFLQLFFGITGSITGAIFVLWISERIARALWSDGDPKEPH